MSETLALSAAAPDEARTLVLLVETVERLSSARTVEDVAAVIRTTARAISGADGVTFVVKDGDKCRYVDEDAIAPLWKGRSFPLEACVSGWAMLNGRMAIIPDIYDDYRVPVDAYRPTFVKSMVMTPVRPDDPIAAIGAYWADHHQPSADEVMKLELVARATATALENAQLYSFLTSAIVERDSLIAELDHRVKNVLASIMSMASQTLRTTASPEEFRTGFNGRLMCLSRAHDLLAAHAWRGAPIAEVVEEAMRPFEALASRLSGDGPDVILAPEAASALLLILYELANNAKAYGAWSNEGGKVDLSWGIDETAEPARFQLSWREQDGPPVSEPERKGFGSRLIETGLARPPSGKAKLSFPPEGAVFDLAAPLSDRIRRP